MAPRHYGLYCMTLTALCLMTTMAGWDGLSKREFYLSNSHKVLVIMVGLYDYPHFRDQRA